MPTHRGIRMRAERGGLGDRGVEHDDWKNDNDNSGADGEYDGEGGNGGGVQLGDQPRNPHFRYDENGKAILFKCDFCPNKTTYYANTHKRHQDGCRYNPAVEKCFYCGTKTPLEVRDSHEKGCSRNPLNNPGVRGSLRPRPSVPPNPSIGESPGIIKENSMRGSMAGDENGQLQTPQHENPSKRNLHAQSSSDDENETERRSAKKQKIIDKSRGAKLEDPGGEEGEAEWMSLPNIILLAKIETASNGVTAPLRRHRAAPYAYNDEGKMIRQWWHFLDLENQEGQPLLTREDIGRVTGRYETYEKWKATAVMRPKRKNRGRFIRTVLDALPKYKFPTFTPRSNGPQSPSTTTLNAHRVEVNKSQRSILSPGANTPTSETSVEVNKSQRSILSPGANTPTSETRMAESRPRKYKMRRGLFTDGRETQGIDEEDEEMDSGGGDKSKDNQQPSPPRESGEHGVHGTTNNGYQYREENSSEVDDDLDESRKEPSPKELSQGAVNTKSGPGLFPRTVPQQKNARYEVIVEVDNDNTKPSAKPPKAKYTKNQEVSTRQRKSTGVIRGEADDAEWMSLHDIIRVAKIDTQKDGINAPLRRHNAAPYAYNVGGALTRQWWHFLEIKDEKGQLLLTPNDIARVARSYQRYEKWKKTAFMRPAWDSKERFMKTVLDAFPDYKFPERNRNYRNKKHSSTLPPEINGSASETTTKTKHSSTLPPEINGSASEPITTNGKLVECEYCKERLHFSLVQSHQELCLLDIVECEFCGTKLPSSKIRFHELTCFPGFRSSLSQCTHCRKKQWKDNLIQHQESCPENPTNFATCSHCGGRIASKSIRLHEDTCWENPTPGLLAQCMFCDKIKEREEIENHQSVCLGNPVNFVKCSLCNKPLPLGKLEHHEKLCLENLNEPGADSALSSDDDADGAATGPEEEVTGFENLDGLTYKDFSTWTAEKLHWAAEFHKLPSKGIRHDLILRLLNKDRSEPITLARCEETGIELSRKSKLCGKENQYSYPCAETVTTLLALHLVCTEQFHEIMGGTVLDPECFLFDNIWLANIKIPGRYSQFDSYKAWRSHFQRKFQDVVAEAQAMYRDLPATLKVMGMENVVSFSPDPRLSTPVRDDIVRYHEMRRRLLNAIKQLAKQQFGIRNSRHGSFFELESPEQQHILLKLLLLQQAEAECRLQLSSTVLEQSISRKLDDLIDRTGIMQTGEPKELSVLQRNTQSTIQDAIAELQRRHKFQPSYYFDKLDYHPISRVTPKKPVIKNEKYHGSVLSTLWLHGSLHEHAQRLASRVQFLFDGVDFERFRTNMEYFSSIQHRLPQLEGGQYPSKRRRRRGRRAAFFQSRDLDPRDLLHDGVYHVKCFFRKILDENQDLPTESLAEAEQIWMRLLAILSLIYGLTDEPSHILSVVDRLLRDLMSYFAVNDHHYTHTYSSQAVLVKQGMVPWSQGPLLQLSFSEFFSSHELARLDRNHSLIAEMARHYRGALMSAYSITATRTKMPQGLKRAVIEGLLHWTCNCGLPGCSEPLYNPESELGKRYISLGTRDCRAGSTRVRAEVSQDRRDTYDCPSTIEFWNNAAGPVLLYLGMPFHPHCKAQRGK